MKNKKLIINIVTVLIALALISTVIFLKTENTDSYTSFAYSTFLSLLPPLVTITLALITKEVYSSLFVGIFTGAMLYANGNAELALTTLAYNQNGGLIPSITDSSHASILVFVILLASLVVMMNRSGGAQAFGNWAKKHIKTKTGAQLATMLMGLLIFVDDGFNCFTVGSVMRPITDSHSISRSKLAYLIDSTAAPVCIIAPVSCWAAAVSYSIPADMNINGFSMFISSIPYNLYALGTLFMVLILILLKKDYGPMKIHEENALKGDLFTTNNIEYEEDEKTNSEKSTTNEGRISNLVIPVISLIIFGILGILYTGGFFSGVDIITAFSEADSAKGLVYGSLITVLLTCYLYMSRNVMSFKVFMESFAAGFRTMCAPMIILILSWNLSGMTRILGATSYIHDAVVSSASSILIFMPAVIYLVSVFLSFSTGTSWGTFTILIPIVCAVFPSTSEMLTISISACLAGAICGDHCSPISDTTIMSSAGSHCNHINHVTTQLPYAITTASVCIIGYILAGLIGYFTDSKMALMATPATLFLLYLVISFITNKQQKQFN